jgi:hypothetical protein
LAMSMPTGLSRYSTCMPVMGRDSFCIQDVVNNKVKKILSELKFAR